MLDDSQPFLNLLKVAQIFVFILPFNAPLWVGPLGGSFATILGKYAFGGFGRNIFNPAILSRVVMMGVFPSIFFAAKWEIDGTTQISPLAKEIEAISPSIEALVDGSYVVTFSQTAPLAILTGGVFLIFFRVIDWRVPLYYIATISLLSHLSFIGERVVGHSQWLVGQPMLQVFGGGTLFAAFFLLADPVTSPMTPSGRILYAILAGINTNYYSLFLTLSRRCCFCDFAD